MASIRSKFQRKNSARTAIRTALTSLFLLTGFGATAAAESNAANAACAFHTTYTEEADLCPALSIKRDVERMLGFSCRILSAKSQDPVPVLAPETKASLSVPKDCQGTCMERAAFAIRGQLVTLRAQYLRAAELKERFDFAERIANQSIAAYESLLARASLIQNQIKKPPREAATSQKLTASR